MVPELELSMVLYRLTGSGFSHLYTTIGLENREQGASQWWGMVMTACYCRGKQRTTWPGIVLPVRGRRSTSRRKKSSFSKEENVLWVHPHFKNRRTSHRGSVCSADVRGIAVVSEITCMSWHWDRLDFVSLGEQWSLSGMVGRLSGKNDGQSDQHFAKKSSSCRDCPLEHCFPLKNKHESTGET